MYSVLLIMKDIEHITEDSRILLVTYQTGGLRHTHIDMNLIVEGKAKLIKEKNH